MSAGRKPNRTRTHMVQLRLGDDEHARLTALASTLDLTMSDVIRLSVRAAWKGCVPFVGVRNGAMKT